MRIKLDKPLTENDLGKTRTISKFLWLPREINYEIRWLEDALIEQVVDSKFFIDKDCPQNQWLRYYWRDTKWVNTPANLK